MVVPGKVFAVASAAAAPHHHHILVFTAFLIVMSSIIASSVALPFRSRLLVRSVVVSSLRQFKVSMSAGVNGGGVGGNGGVGAGGANTNIHMKKHYSDMTIADTPLGTRKGSELLDGLDVYCVPSTSDKHPLSVYGIQSSKPKGTDNVLLMLHGRTWSSVPVYHLHGGPNAAEQQLESHSLMEELLSKNIQVYAMDFRGFGGTPRDATRGVEPNLCVEDVESVLAWILQRHGPDTDLSLLGWSQGALVAQLAAQRRKPKFSKLVLYGSIYDPTLRYPREPLYVKNKESATAPDVQNTFDAAVEDFTIEGTIPPEPANNFAEAALLADPIKARWTHMHQFNNLDPARVHVPTLVVAGDQDPYSPMHAQQELFTNLGRGSDKTWSILANADHAVHLLEGRSRFANVVASFLHNSKMKDDRQN